MTRPTATLSICGFSRAGMRWSQLCEGGWAKRPYVNANGSASLACLARQRDGEPRPRTSAAWQLRESASSTLSLLKRPARATGAAFVRVPTVISDDCFWHAFPCRELGRARQLCPGTSDVDFLCNLKGVIDLNAQVSHRALDLRVAEQQLNRP